MMGACTETLRFDWCTVWDMNEIQHDESHLSHVEGGATESQANLQVCFSQGAHGAGRRLEEENIGDE